MAVRASIASRVVFLNADGEGIPDVVVILDYGDTMSISDKDGNYYFGNPRNGDYSITPSLAGYAFSPPVRMVTIDNESIRADFTGTQGG